MKKWTLEQWNLAAWAIYRQLVEKYGKGVDRLEDVAKWYTNYDKWLKDFTKSRRIGDLRAVAKNVISRHNLLENN